MWLTVSKAELARWKFRLYPKMPPQGRYFKFLMPLADEDELMAHIEKLKNQPA